jgi:hypothetical protein
MSTPTLMNSASLKVSINQTGGQIESTAPVTLKTSTSQSRLDQLFDVVEISPQEGSTLVYRSSDDKYVVQQLSLQNVTGTLDGGTF